MKHIINTKNITFIEIFKEKKASDKIYYESFSKEVTFLGFIISKQIEAGWYYYNDQLITEEEISEKYIDRGFNLYVKPHIKINFIGGKSSIIHYFDSDKELLDYLNSEFKDGFEII